MSTVENELYGGNYKKCRICGITQRGELLTRDGDTHYCIDGVTCQRWKKLIAEATPADITAAAQRLCDQVVPTPDELLASFDATTMAIVTEDPNARKP